MATLLGITGATGLLGGRVAERLAAAGAEQRLLVRNAAHAPDLPGAQVAAIGGYDDDAGMRAALTGVDTLFLVSGREAPNRVAQHIAAVDSAVAAGVSRIVYVSFVGAAPDATFTFARDHWATEEHIRATGLRCTFLRDNFYDVMLPRLVGDDGVIRGPGGEGRVGCVAHDDVADAAAAVLLDAIPDIDADQVYDLTGPEAISLAEAAAQMSRAAGRSIVYVPETVEEAYASRESFGAPQFELDGWVTSYTAIANGDLEVVSSAVRRLTGHPAQTFAEWLAANPGAWERLRGLP
ncbi:SDR family oxidoreductase [Cellulomonas cellasea]|uniref:SDR family oxidoreductase n=1 Tax=Cellulomonas cellasea TaxID=43670 RepID=UPI0025A43D8D|nr:SDR family oxidoreductase [Cellulomonas cellasea]MDM8085069.1 SDR family oxidoreductase [Cellulomonas cellasea]